MDPQQKAIAQEFDRYNTSYKEAVNAALSFSGLEVDFFTRVKAGYLLDLLGETFGDSAGLDVLDVGCGVGNYHALVKPKVKSLSGVDVSSACVARAVAAHPDVSYAAYDGERLPYDDETFDAAFTICVMHHVPPPAWPGFVAEMARVLRPGGLALVFEHNPRNPLTMKVVNRCAFDRDAVLLRAEDTVRLFEAAFERVESSFILTVPAANRLLRAVDRLFSGLPLGAQYYVRARKPAGAAGGAR
jgi:ubiquinone/menaquinone biosynthesis C-methylase UbiE